ncbi:CopG family transcriptional regulator [Antarcticibacterium flavum]|uniref:CopG family transcriptional regulator n=1 Tax=Antarcticibacterium flavum TaxID=2058175 RepID=A0A5B7X7K2_9FLAO|nr:MULTISPECIES: type II toxin-antitoxin system ParD family antitoxin [Antarcticibacterium]MCM4161793.1 CopG family transcriptional regulator [Antarcticibacterium sp. W02-3]QCY70603.1 CopG family transcriptional regulator [Antarcticibacterium flavum]
MARQSITLTKPNDKWLKEQLSTEEYTSKSELINDLIRRAREKQEELDFLRAELIKGEQSGFTKLTQEEILAQSKADLRRNGKL